MSARRCAVAAVFGPEPWNVLWWWNDAPPARTTTGASSSSASSPAGFARRAGASQSGGAWNSPRFLPLTGQRCDPGTNEIVPASAEVSSSAIQQVIISGGSR